MLFGRSRKSDVSSGFIFRRTRDSRVTETAEVVSVMPDRAGIPHVRYRLSIARPARCGDPAEDRTLALSAFTELFRERVTA